MSSTRKMRGRKGLHIEAEGCIVNIYEDLHNTTGQLITSVEIIADQNDDNWLIENKDHYHRVRVIKQGGEKE